MKLNFAYYLPFELLTVKVNQLHEKCLMSDLIGLSRLLKTDRRFTFVSLEKKFLRNKGMCQNNAERIQIEHTEHNFK